jgi:ABC-type Na+ efflux pump permease subunit
MTGTEFFILAFFIYSAQLFKDDKKAISIFCWFFAFLTGIAMVLEK